MNTACAMDSVPAAKLHEALGFKPPPSDADVHTQNRSTSGRWKKTTRPFFATYTATSGPRRHLEFGTWQGQGLLYCLEECRAPAWTLNLLDGSGSNLTEATSTQTTLKTRHFRTGPPEPAWSAKAITTDALGFIG